MAPYIPPVTFPTTPISNITPFTYRDGYTFLEIFEAFRKYLNTVVIPGINETVDTLIENYNTALQEVIDQGNQNREELIALITQFEADLLERQTEYEEHIQSIVDTINNKSGMIDVQHVELIDDYEVVLDPLWPKNLPVIFEFVQDSVGGHVVTLPAHISGSVTVNPAANSRTLIAIYPSPTDLDPLSGDAWTATYLDDSYDRIVRRYWSVKEFGAYGDGVHDDTAAIQACADFVFTNYPDAAMYFPPGTYRTEGTVSIKCAVEEDGATIKYYGDRTCIILGDETNYVIARKTFRLPRIINQRNITLAQFDGASIGVRALNLNACELHVPFIQAFEEGLVCEGLGHGFAYTNVYPFALWANHRNLVLRPKNLGGVMGWVNQNQFFGGRLQSPDQWGIADDSEANQILFEQPSGSTGPNNNTFVGTSIEGPNKYLYKLDLSGRYNRFLNCRFESVETTRIHYGPFAHYNEIDGGYNLDDVQEVFEVGSLRNVIRQRNAVIRANANQATAKTIPVDDTPSNPAPILIDTWATLTGYRYTHSAGVFTFRQGSWHIEAQITLRSPAGGRVQFIMRGSNGTDIAIDVQTLPVSTSGSTGLVTLRVSREIQIDEAVTGVSFYVRNFTTDELIHIPGPAFNYMTATYRAV